MEKYLSQHLHFVITSLPGEPTLKKRHREFQSLNCSQNLFSLTTRKFTSNFSFFSKFIGCSENFFPIVWKMLICDNNRIMRFPK